MMARIWGWVSAVLGLAVVVVTYVDGAMIGVWADEHPSISGSLPDEIGQFVVAGIGGVLLLGGIIVGLRRPSRNDGRSEPTLER